MTKPDKPDRRTNTGITADMDKFKGARRLSVYAVINPYPTERGNVAKVYLWTERGRCRALVWSPCRPYDAERGTWQRHSARGLYDESETRAMDGIFIHGARINAEQRNRSNWRAQLEAAGLTVHWLL